MRSFWKGPVLLKSSFNKKKNLRIIKRQATVFPCFVGKFFLVKDGKNYLKTVFVKEEMVGFKFGSFVLTKKISD